jgi:hypothetical protein
MKKFESTLPKVDKSAYETHEQKIVMDKQFRAYLDYCVKEGCLEPDEAEQIVENKDWERVEYMMDYGDYLANSAEDERGWFRGT